MTDLTQWASKSPVLQEVIRDRKIAINFIPGLFGEFGQIIKENIVVKECLLRLQGMLLIERNSPGSISREAFVGVKNELHRYCTSAMKPDDHPRKLLENDSSDRALVVKDEIPPLTADRVVEIVFERAIGNVLAMEENPSNPAHQRERGASIDLAIRAGHFGRGKSLYIDSGTPSGGGLLR